MRYTAYYRNGGFEQAAPIECPAATRRRIVIVWHKSGIFENATFMPPFFTSAHVK